jgi:hypothetical protein
MNDNFHRTIFKNFLKQFCTSRMKWIQKSGENAFAKEGMRGEIFKKGVK